MPPLNVPASQNSSATGVEKPTHPGHTAEIKYAGQGQPAIVDFDFPPNGVPNGAGPSCDVEIKHPNMVAQRVIWIGPPSRVAASHDGVNWDHAVVDVT